MQLGDKLKVLREIEGACRGRPRGLTKAETVKLIQDELGATISLAYLSQLESGRRSHMTNTTRLLLARFFKIHPGFLVEDPDDFRVTLGSPVSAPRDGLRAWLRAGAARFRHDALVGETLERLASHQDRRKALRLVHHLLAMPELLDRLLVTLEAKRR